MAIRKNKYPVLNLIKPQHILASVFDKGLFQEITTGILEINPAAMFYSTGGTGKEIMSILGERASSNYMSVEEFTGAPEMEGGLVKTLHPKIHSGLLAERGNPAHEKYLAEEMARFGKGPGVYFDIFIGNLYPFENAVNPEKTPDTNPEVARINIDIGGPAMTMGTAKNWHSVAVLTDPVQYSGFIERLKYLGGTDLKMRFQLAAIAIELIGKYRTVIGNYFGSRDFNFDIMPTLNIAGGE